MTPQNVAQEINYIDPRPCGCVHYKASNGKFHNNLGPAVDAEFCRHPHKSLFFLNGKAVTKQEHERFVKMSTCWFHGKISEKLVQCYVFVAFHKMSHYQVINLEHRWGHLGGSFDDQISHSINVLLQISKTYP